MTLHAPYADSGVCGDLYPLCAFQLPMFDADTCLTSGLRCRVKSADAMRHVQIRACVVTCTPAAPSSCPCSMNGRCARLPSIQPVNRHGLKVDYSSRCFHQLLHVRFSALSHHTLPPSRHLCCSVIGRRLFYCSSGLLQAHPSIAHPPSARCLSSLSSWSKSRACARLFCSAVASLPQFVCAGSMMSARGTVIPVHSTVIVQLSFTRDCDVS